jgi:hypothetical protein
MKRNLLLVVAALLSALVLGGCATLFNDEYQTVMLDAPGQKVSIEVYSNGGTKPQKGTTPLLVQARRSNVPLIISVKEDKCAQASTYEQDPGVGGTFFVNVLWCLAFLCPLSSTTDLATERMWKYEEQANVPVDRKASCS